MIKQFKQLDYEYSYKIATLLAKDSSIRKFFQLITFSGTAFFWIIMLPIWYFYLSGGDEAITLGLVTGFMLIPVFILKQTIRRNRPDFKDTRFGTVAFDEWSFPSGHATRSTYVTILLSMYIPELWIIWLIWGIIMISSRLLLGVHYISDIISGILLSAFTIYILLLVDILPIIKI